MRRLDFEPLADERLESSCGTMDRVALGHGVITIRSCV
jgi:hypothetical protein